MSDDLPDLQLFDQLVENTGETGEQGQPELDQSPSWTDPLATAERPT